MNRTVIGVASGQVERLVPRKLSARFPGIDWPILIEFQKLRLASWPETVPIKITL